MKYLFSLAVPLLLLLLAFYPKQEATFVSKYEVSIQDYQDFGELVFDCSGESTLGAKCSGSGDCTCSSGVFRCKCKAAFVYFTPPTDESWEQMLDIIGTEETDIAKGIVDDINTLKSYADSNNQVGYDELADQLDEDIMNLQEDTIEKILEAFVG